MATPDWDFMGLACIHTHTCMYTYINKCFYIKRQKPLKNTVFFFLTTLALFLKILHDTGLKESTYFVCK